MSEGSSSLIESVHERLFGPRRVVFSNGLRMEASVNGPEPSVVLCSNKEILLDLKFFAPENTLVRFDPKGKWGAYPGDVRRAPILQIGKFKGADAILDFLHECGHLQDPVLTDLAVTADNQYNDNYFGKSSSHDPERLKSLKESKRLVLCSERDAWDFALNNARQLEREFGIDIIGRMGGIDKTRRYINFYIQHYEDIYMHEFEYLGIEFYSKEHMEDFLSKIT